MLRGTFANEPILASGAALPSIDAGLSSAEALRRLTQFGPNAIIEEHLGPARRVLRHFWTPATPAGRERIRTRTRPPDQLQAAFLTSIFCCLAAWAVFGKVTVSTPFAMSAAILSASMPSGSAKERWKEPYARSET